MIVEKRKNLKSAIYEPLVFFLVMFTCQHPSFYPKYVSCTVVYLQGRGIFMSGQDQNRRRAMSGTERGWWVSGLITDWISGLKAKDSSWEHVCDSQASHAESDRSCLEGMWCIRWNPILQWPRRQPQPALQTTYTGLQSLTPLYASKIYPCSIFQKHHTVALRFLCPSYMFYNMFWVTLEW